MNTIKTTPKDFFLHLGATIALYASAIALINLAFSTVNYAFPDALAGYFSVSSIVWPISMLVVLIPVLYVLEWVVRRDIVKVPEKREVWVRRWRIYLTLFLTGATIAGDLIALINTYLNGEISARFIYKILIVLAVSAVIFTYYILERMSDSGKSRKVLVLLAWVGIALVIASIVGGFIIVGSPANQRALRFDEQRVNDLQSIQWQIINYWQRKQALPTDLSGLNDPLSYFNLPSDPETKMSYEFNVKRASNAPGLTNSPMFELCATFSRQSVDTADRGAYTGLGGSSMTTAPVPVGGASTDSWAHPAGRVCFERTIDRQLYPPIQAIPAKGI